jgi:hypothetical protein
MGATCGTYGGDEGCIKVFAGKPEGKRPIGKPRHIYMGRYY